MQVLYRRICSRNTGLHSILQARLFSNSVSRTFASPQRAGPESSSINGSTTSPRRFYRNLDTISRNMRPTVGVIGGGISGLRCSDILLENGFEVTVLEARNRLGGRMHQESLSNGHVVDLGPNWIHGTDDNPILELAEKTKTTTHSWEDEADNLFDSQGKPVNNASEISSTFWGTITEAFRYSEKHTETIDPEKSLWDFFLDNTSKSNSDEERENAKLLLQVAEMWGAFVGTPITRQSLKFFWLEECIDGENLFCASTYKNILAEISKPAIKQSTIHFNTEVDGIDTRSARPIVRTKDGQSLQFDEVVVTTPLGWLKKNKGIFNPELPTRLCEAIDYIGYGNLEKVYLSFPHAFWLGPKDHSDTRSPAGFTQWLHPSYAKPPAQKNWNQEAVDLATLPGPCAHPTLLFYIYGDQGSLIANKWKELENQKERTSWLAEYFKPYLEKLLHYDGNSTDCVPSYCLATSWTTDNLAGNGSYCNFPVGLKEGDKDIEVMREGVPQRNLWFAGEHTAPFVALGTVTGAYWSGEKVAQRIAEKYGQLTVIGDSQKDPEVAGSGDGKGLNVRGFASD